MAARASDADPLPRHRRPLRRGAESRDPLLPPQSPFGGGGPAAIYGGEGKKTLFCVVAVVLPAEEESAAVENRNKPLNRLNIHSAFWILASIAVTYYFDFLNTVKETIEADSWWFASGSCLLAACLSVALYCILYLEWYHGIEDYDIQYPALIPITTATFIAAAICFNVALWPVWTFMTPVLLFIQFMGVVMFVSLLG